VRSEEEEHGTNRQKMVLKSLETVGRLGMKYPKFCQGFWRTEFESEFFSSFPRSHSRLKYCRTYASAGALERVIL
jgi:hypothetical protein